MYKFVTLVSSILLSCTTGFIQSTPLYGEIESDLDSTRQSITKANQILASINRDVDLCLTNAVACSLKSYDDLDYQTFDSSQAATGYSGGNLDSTNYTDVDQSLNETNAAVPTTLAPSVSPAMYGPVPPPKIVVPPSSDQKFTHVLDDLDSLEVHVSTAIANFTTTRRFTYTAMLKPMLKHIHQLRSNLSLLRNRLIGVAALTNIASQVNELTDHISDALVGGSDVPLDDTPSDGSSNKQNVSPKPSSTTTSTTTTVKAEPTLPSSTPLPSSSESSPSSAPSSSSSSTSPSTSPSPSSSPSTLPSSSFSPSEPQELSSSSIVTTIASVELSDSTTKSSIISEENDVDEVNTITSTIKTV